MQAVGILECGFDGCLYVGEQVVFILIVFAAHYDRFQKDGFIPVPDVIFGRHVFFYYILGQFVSPIIRLLL